MLVDLVTGAALGLPFAVIAARVGRVTGSGAAIGLLLASIVYAAFYFAGLAVVGVALLLTIVSSRANAPSRDASGGDEGHRGARNVLANCVVGTVGAALELTGTFGPDSTSLWFVTAIAAGASDTVASEIGRRFGGTPRTFPTWHQANPGTPGAISAIGTASGAAAAAAIALPAAVLWLVSYADLPIVVVACVAGSLVESTLATTFETRHLLGNDALNVLNTASSAAIAVALSPLT